MVENKEFANECSNQCFTEENALEVLAGGVETNVQNVKGEIGDLAIVVSASGVMDSYNFRIGNQLLGNDADAAGLEMILNGGGYRFKTRTSFSITGSDMSATLDGEPVPMYRVIQAMAAQVLKFGTCTKGMRTYLLIAGGLELPEKMDSYGTFVNGKLRAGDLLKLMEKPYVESIASYNEEYIPKITNSWTIGVLPNLQLSSKSLELKCISTLTSSKYTVDLKSGRSGIALNGLLPKVEKNDLIYGDSDTSNINHKPCSLGSLILTDEQIILVGPDIQSLDGIICPLTIVKGELWKLGQLRPEDKVNFQLLTLEQAETLSVIMESNIEFNYKQPKFLKFDFGNL